MKHRTLRPPVVSICVPMYRSACYLTSLISQVLANANEDVEFVFADHHGLDDAAERLRQQFAGNPRVRVFTSQRQLSWVANYNFLMHEARGEFFRWLAHDDRLPPGGLERQIGLMREFPDAVCIAPRVDRRTPDDQVLTPIDARQIRPILPDEPWTLWHALSIFARRRYGGSFKGLWRRELLMRHCLEIRPTRDLIEPERVWLFAAALLGRFVYDKDFGYIKSIHSGSVSAGWKIGWRHDFSGLLAGLSYLHDLRGLPLTLACLPMMAASALVNTPLRRLVRRALQKNRCE